MLESILNPKNAEDKPLHVFGIAILYSFVAMIFAQQLFTLQTETLGSIGAPTGKIISAEDFTRFFLNNTKVMTLIFILSAVMGAGAVFILAWNASVIGVFLG